MNEQNNSENYNLKEIIFRSIPVLVGLAGLVVGGIVARESGGPAGMAVFGISTLSALGIQKYLSPYNYI